MNNLKKFLCLFILLASGSADAFPFGKSVSSITPTAETVTANLASTSNTIPLDFVGISWESSSFIEGDFQGSSGASLLNIIKLLGINGNLRIGGSSGDLYITAPALTQALANGIASFLNSTGSGWTITYQLDWNVSSSYLTQIGYILTAFTNFNTTSNVIFELGNEQGGADTGSIDSTYVTAWNNLYAVISGTYPSLKWEAVECSSDCGGYYPGIEATVNALTPGISNFKFVSYHQYLGSGYYAPASNFLPGGMFPKGTFAADIPGKIRLGEWNTESSGGYQGVSDRLLSAAFYLETCMNLATAGYAGVNAHEVNNYSGFSGAHLNPTGAGTNAAYAGFVQQVDGGWTPAPKFYGEYLFSKLQGQVIAATSKSGTGNVNAFATVGTGGNANILVVNNDPYRPVTLTPTQSSGTWTTAKIWNVGSATNNWCYDNVATLNGQVIGEGGSNVAGPITISNGATVTIVPCGAALIEIQP